MRLSDVEGDSELAEFCRLEWPRLVGSLTLYTGERDLAEDLAQEALIRACQHWAKVREAASRSAWVHRVAFNLAKSQFRRRATLRRVQRLEIVESSTREPDAALHLAVRSAVAALPEPQRRALVLRYFSDLPVREVATLMGCRRTQSRPIRVERSRPCATRVSSRTRSRSRAMWPLRECHDRRRPSAAAPGHSRTRPRDRFPRARQYCEAATATPACAHQRRIGSRRRDRERQRHRRARRRRL